MLPPPVPLPAGFIISTDPEKLDLKVIHHFLRSSYWAQNIPLETVRRSVAHSLCFGLYHGSRQIGFARVVTDFATVSYLCDVFVIDAYRGQGLGKQLMAYISRYPELQGLRRWMLFTADAHGLYAPFGFTPLARPERGMEIVAPKPYG